MLLLTLGTQLAMFDYFVMPGPDFLDVRATAERFARLEAPLSFRVAPLYPALIAATHGLFDFGGEDAPDPLLRAAEVWNVLFAVLAAYWLFRIGEHFLGRWGFLLPLLHFLHPAVTGEMIAQPLVEQTLLTTTVATVALAIRGSRWAWLAAGLAAVARYEGVGLLAGLALKELIERRPLPSIALRGAAASAMLAAWLGWSMVAGGTLNPYVKEIATGENPYLESGARASCANFVKMAAFSLLRFLPEGTAYLEGEGDPQIAIAFETWPRRFLWTACAAAAFGLIASGAVLAWRRDRGGSAVILTFVAFYAVVHTLYPVTLEKHFFNVHWALYLFALIPGLALARRAATAPAVTRIALPLASAAALLALAPSPMTLTAPFDDDLLKLDGWSPRTEDGNKGVETIILYDGERPSLLADAAAVPSRPELLRLPISGARHVAGAMWRAEAPLPFRADNQREDGTAVLRLYEDDKPLGPAASGQEGIQTLGGGRYSLWAGDDGLPTLYFSTSDGSLPTENGRRYWAGDIRAAPSPWMPEDPRGRVADADGLLFGGRALTAPASAARLRLRFVYPTDAVAELTCPVGGAFAGYAPSWASLLRRPPPATAPCETTQAFPGPPPELSEARPAGGAVALESLRAFRAPGAGHLALWAAILVLAARAVAPLRRGPAWALGIALLAAFHFASVVELQKIRQLNHDFRVNYAEQYRAGQWLRRNSDDSDLLVAENQHILQYAARGRGPQFRDIEKPVAGDAAEAVVEGLRAEGVTLLVVDGEDVQAHERIGAKLAIVRAGAAALPGLKLVHAVDEGLKWADIYRIAPRPEGMAGSPANR